MQALCLNYFYDLLISHLVQFGIISVFIFIEYNHNLLSLHPAHVVGFTALISFEDSITKTEIGSKISAPGLFSAAKIEARNLGTN